MLKKTPADIDALRILDERLRWLSRLDDPPRQPPSREPPTG